MQTSKRIHIPTDQDYIEKLNQLLPPADYRVRMDFGAYRRLFSVLGIQSPLELFEEIPDRVKRATATQAVFSQAWTKITAGIEDWGKAKPLLVELWDQLAEEDKLRKTDAVFVIGGKVPWRRGVVLLDILSQGLVDKIVLTGDRPFFVNKSANEADTLFEYLIARGVSADRFIAENQARNTTENIFLTHQVMVEQGYLPKSVILLAGPMQMKRAYLTLKVLGPKLGWRPKVVRKTVGIWVDRNNYFEDFDEFCLLMNEYTKIYYSFCQDRIK